MKAKDKEQIEILLEDFNFENVQTILTVLKRPWKQGSDIPKIPSIEEIKNMAEHCLLQVANSSDPSAYYEIYGLEAEKIEGAFELRFVPERVNTLKPLQTPDFKNELARKP